MLGDPVHDAVAVGRARPAQHRRLDFDVDDGAPALGQHDEAVPALHGDRLQGLEPLHGVRVAVQEDRPRRPGDPELAWLQALVDADVDAVLGVRQGPVAGGLEARAQVRRQR